MAKVTILGSGSWGIALANSFVSAGHLVTLWGRDQATLEEVAETGIAKKYFLDLAIPKRKIFATEQITVATKDAELIVFAIPSSAFRLVSKSVNIKPPQLLLSATKGLEKSTDLRMTEILNELFSNNLAASLSGPSFAHEIIQGKPAALTIAAKTLDNANKFQSLTHSSTMRIYTSEDLVGVELGGTIKNVIAIAAGIVDGAEIGVNARAALLTRGLSEMSRLIVAAGGKLETAMGLSGMGDLILTATSDLSRNRRVGLLLGKGGSLAGALAEISQVSEGVNSAAQVVDLASKYKVQMPICEEVLKLLEGKSSVKESVVALLSRVPVRE